SPVDGAEAHAAKRCGNSAVDGITATLIGRSASVILRAGTVSNSCSTRCRKTLTFPEVFDQFHCRRRVSRNRQTAIASGVDGSGRLVFPCQIDAKLRTRTSAENLATRIRFSRAAAGANDYGGLLQSTRARQIQCGPAQLRCLRHK